MLVNEIVPVVVFPARSSNPYCLLCRCSRTFLKKLNCQLLSVENNLVITLVLLEFAL